MEAWLLKQPLLTEPFESYCAIQLESLVCLFVGIIKSTVQIGAWYEN